MPRRYYVLLTAITLVGAFLRLWQLASVPPGLHYDLAATALLGNEVAFNGYRPIFISAFTGHEALYYYWLALWFRLVGSSVFSLRLAAAMLGILAIPASFFAVREAMRFDKELSFPLAALAAAFLATSFWNLVFSRYGFRVISEPVVQALALGFLFKGIWETNAAHTTHQASGRLFSPAQRTVVLRHRATIYLIIAGLLTGAAADTYLAARLFPVPLAVFWLVLLGGALLRRPGGQGRRLLSAFAAFSLAALAAFAPLGLYFLNNPQDFLNRASQVAPRPGETALLLTGIRRALEMLFINGEPYDRFNIPGQPLFGSVLAFFFEIGLLVTLKNVVFGAARPPRRPGIPGAPTPPHPQTPTHALSLATEILLLAWLPAMLLPTALAVHDIFPSNMRASGLIPLLFVFPARGLLVSYRWVQKRMPGPMIPYAYPLVVVTLAALVLGAFTARTDYFTIWNSLPDQRQNNDADLVDMAAYLNVHDTRAESVYVSAIHYRHPTLAYLAHDFDQLHWLTGGTALVLPANQPALYLFARSAPPPDEWLAGWAPHQVAAPLDPDGVPVYRAYQFAAGEAPPQPAFAPLNENFGNFVTLTGYRVITQTDKLLLDLRWQVANVPDTGDYLPYARLTDAWGSGWSQSGGFSYPSEQWQPGDTVLTRLTLPLLAGMPPGSYDLTAGFYSAGAKTDMPHLAANGAFAGIRAPITILRLPGGPALAGGPGAVRGAFRQANPVLPTDRVEICILPGDNGQLLGYSLERSALRQGEWMHLTLYWWNEFHVGANALTIALGNQMLYTGQPVHGTYPFDQWSIPQVLIDRYALKVPADAPAGSQPLMINLSGGKCVAPLGAINVGAVDRVYTLPPVAVPISPAAGTLSAPGSATALAALAGYTVTAGRPATLSLAWHALAPMEQDYSVFVHVLDGAGQLVAQADAEPRAGSYPTSLWQPGEYLTDDYHFSLPPGRYTAQVGLYLPENGQRLAQPGGAADFIVLPEFEIR